MKADNKFIREKAIFIANGVVFCLIIILLLFLKLHTILYSNPLFSVLSVAVFIMIVFWKLFIVLIGIVSILGLVNVVKNKFTDSPIVRICNETVFTTFGLVLSTAIGFIFSMTVRTGKPDIDPKLFFSYFNIVFILYWVVRLGTVLLVHIRKTRQ